jgi:hypothetical protein
MPRKPKPQPDDPEQSKRFMDMAREIGADEGAAGRKAFERTFKKVLGKKQPSASETRHKTPRTVRRSDS